MLVPLFGLLRSPNKIGDGIAVPYFNFILSGLCYFPYTWTVCWCQILSTLRVSRSAK